MVRFLMMIYFNVDALIIFPITMVLFVDLNALLMFPSGTEDNAYPVLPLSTTILTPKSVNTVLLLAKSTMKDWELVPSDCFIFDNIICI